MRLSERISMVITGIIYLAIGLLIITHPKFLYYGVAIAFFVQGVSSLFRSIAAPQEKKTKD